MRLFFTGWFLLVLLFTDASLFAQPIPVPLGRVANDPATPPPVRRVWARDVTTYYQMGWQSLTLAPLNAELARLGYPPLSGVFRTMGLGAQIKMASQPLFLHTEFNLGLGTRPSTNGLNKVSMGVSTFRLGVGYRALQRAGFQLIPHLGILSMPLKLRVSPVQQPTPSLSAALTSSGSAPASVLTSVAGAFDVGLTANYRFGVQRGYDDCTNFERSLALAFDAGYRLGSQPDFLTEANPVRRVAFSASGWYAGLRLGAGLRSDRGKATRP